MNGYAGKILRINLSTKEISTLDTSDYEQWGGGHGIGSAVFFELVKDKSIDGFDPANVVTIMTSPLTGTIAVGASARTEVQGIGVQSYPVGWFTRSNFGGRFGVMLKMAGWDGVAIEGKADRPIWVDIRDDAVKIMDCSELSLWGKDTWEAQQEIWDYVAGSDHYGKWYNPRSGSDVRTTQQPAVLCIGPAGENLCRVASLVHDAGNGAGQGGFGAVWGSKNLKAISVIGTGTIAVADPKALVDARIWAIQNFTFPLDTVDKEKAMTATMPSNLRSFPSPLVTWERPKESRPRACMGCQAGCRCRYSPPSGNESSCKESFYYAPWVFKIPPTGETPDPEKHSADLLQKYGINAAEPETGIPYLRELYKMGVIGPGKEIDCDLPFDKIGGNAFIEQLLSMITYRQGIGDDMAEGFARAAERWGRLEDMQTGVLNNCHWGLAMHYDPRVSLEWGYGTILGDRDINEHGFNPFYMTPTIFPKKLGTAEEFVKLFSDRMPPFEDDPLMLDFSDGNMYSEHICKLVAWHRHYGRFWIQSALFCDFQYPDFFNWSAKGYKGITGEGEPKFYNAVTGKNLSFAEGIELGRKIWNLDNAIWTLQGRHRDMVQFADYIHDKQGGVKFTMPVNENGNWEYKPVGDRVIDRTQFEEFKTRYYQLEGWDTETGWPTRSTLKNLGMESVADELESKGKLGRE